MKKISLPLSSVDIGRLKAGDEVLLSGVVYTARDAAHKKITAALKGSCRPVFDLKNAVIYYAGPAGKPAGRPIGSCGPTTSNRMDAFTPLLLQKGVRGMIGKGRRNDAVRKAIKKYGAVYFLAPAGAGALLSEKIKSAKCIAYKELGPEAIFRLTVEDFPAIVGIDSRGIDIYGR